MLYYNKDTPPRKCYFLTYSWKNMTFSSRIIYKKALFHYNVNQNGTNNTTSESYCFSNRSNTTKKDTFMYKMRALCIYFLIFLFFFTTGCAPKAQSFDLGTWEGKVVSSTESGFSFSLPDRLVRMSENDRDSYVFSLNSDYGLFPGYTTGYGLPDFDLSRFRYVFPVAAKSDISPNMHIPYCTLLFGYINAKTFENKFTVDSLQLENFFAFSSSEFEIEEERKILAEKEFRIVTAHIDGTSEVFYEKIAIQVESGNDFFPIVYLTGCGDVFVTLANLFFQQIFLCLLSA